MEPLKNYHEMYSDWHDVSTIDPIGGFILAVLVIAMFKVERKYASFLFIIMLCFVPMAQQVVIFSLNFSLLRLLILAGWVRVLLKGEYSDFRLMTLDKLVIAWVLVGAVTYVALHASMASFILKLGNSFDILGMFFLCRLFFKTWEDVIFFL